MQIIELAESDEQIRSAFPIMRQLRPHLDADAFVECIRRLRRTQCFHLLNLLDSGTVVCVAGFRLGESLAWGKYLYVDDLVSDESARSRGYGEKLLSWMKDHGARQGCVALHLDSGVQRHAAHRFYLRERMDIVFFHFRCELGSAADRPKGGSTT